jgi:opacity protein-like surface antigen
MKLKAGIIAGLMLLGLGSTPALAWTGCGVGGHGSLINGDVDFGGPTNIGSNGYAAGLNVACDYRFGNGPMVIGAFADYSWIFGDIQSIGVNAEMAGGARAGVLLNDSTLLYTLVAKTRLMTDLAGNVDGWAFGGGVQMKLPSSPLYVSLEYRHSMLDVADIAPGLNASTDTVRLGVLFKMGGNPLEALK